MKQIGRAMADTTGMLDTARQIVWAEISTQTPPSEKHDEIALLRNARLWHESTRPIESINHNPGTKAQTPNKQHYPDKRPPTSLQTLPPTSRPPLPAEPCPQGGMYLHATPTQRQARGKAMLDAFNKTPSPTSITTHLSTFDSTNELARITECLLHGKYEIESTTASDTRTPALSCKKPPI